ncbi:MAG: hypothetical protein CFH06_00856 [Alphaproteobacteria bacterium MarineAlpha3_Bin5]|nr:MAG: hypothetical protein CFH06_00856 [Alphaproteobacteria bacterium MarineAlpha3_Bin5]
MSMLIEHPYLMFLGDAPDELAAKVAIGVHYWRPDWCLGQTRLDGCAADLGLPDLTIKNAAKSGCKTMVIGVANRGGVIPETWIGSILEALDSGLHIAAGLHQRLVDIRVIADAAEKNSCKLIDARHPTREFNVANGIKRSGKRLLTVGTDVSVGKMFTSLAIEREMLARKLNARFVATGQTGIFIAGDGVSVDAVISDFVSGAAEWLSPEAAPDHWHIIEGQGSLFHTSYAGVTLGLIHGSQPDALVLCHDVARSQMRGLVGRAPPDLKECISANEWAARIVNPKAKVIGISLNTKSLSNEEAERVIETAKDDCGLPVCDPVRTDISSIVDALEV